MQGCPVKGLHVESPNPAEGARGARAIGIIRDFTPDLPAVPVVAVEIEQVFLNLLKNAAQAMRDNPPVKKPRLTLRTRREGACFTVRLPLA